MRERRSARWATIGLLVFVTVGFPALAGARIERELALEPGGSFSLDTCVGSVNVVGTSASGARLVITSRQDDLESRYVFRFVEEPGRVDVKVERKGPKSRSWFNFGRGGSLEFEIQLPHETALDLSTSGGAVSVQSTVGPASLDTSGGAVKAIDVRGNVNADTSGGSITVRDVTGNVNADTSGGGITIERVDGEVLADTSGGRITIEDVTRGITAGTSGGSIRIKGAGGAVHADTSGGSVTVAFAPGNQAGGSLSSSGGGVTVYVDPTANLDLDASTSGGSVSSDLPVTVRGQVSRGSLRGPINSGGAQLRLRSSGGPIRVEPL